MPNKTVLERSAEGRVHKRPTLGDLDARTTLPVVACMVPLIWLYAPTFAWWYTNWTSEETYYEHGLAVPFISAALLWLMRRRILNVPIRAYTAGFAVLVPVLLGVVIVSWAGPSSPLGLSFPVVIASIVLALFGPALLRSAAFPVGLLYFMCVLPGFLLVKASFRIQMMSTQLATGMLRAVGLDATRDGATIHLPSIEVLVGAPCSGFRLLITLYLIALLVAYVLKGPKWGKVLLLLITSPLSVVLNSFRIALIAVVGQHWGADAMHSFHDWSGYIMILLAIISLFGVAWLLKCRELNSTLTL